MSKSVFISHAVKDSKIAEALVDLLEGGIGVPSDEIFCSSLPGHGIPAGSNFVSYMKEQLQSPVTVILLLTPSYFSSSFCLSELGACWALSHYQFPILVSPLTHADIKDVLLGVQVSKIDDGFAYNQLRDYLQSEISCNVVSNVKWDVKRKAYLERLDVYLPQVHVPLVINAEKHRLLQAELDECKVELSNYDRELCTVRAYVKELEGLKDYQQVKKLKKVSKPDNVAESFEELVGVIADFKSEFAPPVFKFILSEHYGKPYSINYGDDAESFEDAARSNFLDLEDSASVVWTNRVVKDLASSLSELQQFVEDDAIHLKLEEYHLERYNQDLEIDSQRFWKQHYSI